MNKLHIIGNLTRDPELRAANTANGAVSVCDFTVAVNRRQKNAQGQNEADYFRVTAWRGLGENCQKYLAKGRKVAVTGPVSCRTYTGNDGVTRASLEVTADDVEFLSPRQEDGQSQQAAQTAPPPREEQQRLDPQTGYAVVEEDDLPF
jgi:single-strand DNA-binding protein